MFKRLIDNIMWESRFNDRRKFVQEYVLTEIWSRGLEEKVLYWRAWGRKFGKTPEEAIYQAVFDFCEEFRLGSKKNDYANEKLRKMALAMAKLKEAKYEAGILIMPEEQLTQNWKPYLK